MPPGGSVMQYALGLIALLPVLQTHANPRREGAAARPEESAPAKLDERLKSLADEHVAKERPSRNPAVVRVQIGWLKARKLTMLGPIRRRIRPCCRSSISCAFCRSSSPHQGRTGSYNPASALMCAAALRPSAFRLYPPSSTETMRSAAWVRATAITCSVIQA